MRNKFPSCWNVNEIFIHLLADFPLANFFARSDLFPLSVSLITSARRGKMDADKGKRSLSAKKFACGKPALVCIHQGAYIHELPVRARRLDSVAQLVRARRLDSVARLVRALHRNRRAAGSIPARDQ